MARTVSVIQAQIISSMAANANLDYVDENNITRNITENTSTRAIWRAITFVVATCIAIFEQLQDLYLAVVEAIVARSAAASALWIQDKLFKFQYSTTNPQIVQLIDTVPQYPIIDTTLQIITACSVTSDASNSVNIKVAQGDPFFALDAAMIAAAQGYINTIGVAGINYSIISLTADKLYIDATIYYQGQYSVIIKTSAVTALNSYLQTLSKTNFDGSIKMSDLENVIRTVTGVNDVVMNNVKARPNTTLFANGVFLIQNAMVRQRLYNPDAGYLIQEDTAGETFLDSLTFIAQ